MKIYYSNITSGKYEDGRMPQIGVLQSYATIRKIKIPYYCDSYFLDSGAFTTSKSGKPINLMEYIQFLKENAPILNVYAALDVIGDAEASWINYEKMLDAGLQPLPAFHEGEPEEWLHKMAGVTDYIGLGGMVGAGKNRLHKFLDKVFTLYPDPEKVGFHGYGIMDEDLILGYPWKSVDATSVHVMARFGGIFTPQRKAVKLNPKVRIDDQGWKTTKAVDIVRSWVESLGFNYDVAQEQSSLGTRERVYISVAYYESLHHKAMKVFKPTTNFFL